MIMLKGYHSTSTRAPRNRQTHKFAPPCPERMFRECSMEMPNCVNGYIGDQEMSDKTRND